jgi:CBS domain-containing protein
MGNTTVQEAMTPSPKSIESDASVIDAARLLTSEDVGSLPVVEGDQLVGMVTDRDLVLRVLAKDLDPHKTVVADACTEDPEVASASESLEAASQRMAQNAAVGGASPTDPSYQGGQMNLQARRQTANQMAGRRIDEQAEGANFDAKLKAASMLEQSRMQSESLQNQIQQRAMGYMPWNQGGGGGSIGPNNFNLAEERRTSQLDQQADDAAYLRSRTSYYNTQYGN